MMQPASFDAAGLVALPPQYVSQTYCFRDTILYALGLGLGEQAAQGQGLEYVYEDGLIALPTMAVALAAPGFWYREPRYGIAWEQILHAEQDVEFHRPLPAEGTLRSEFRITSIIDKGTEKGALLTVERRLLNTVSSDLLATIRQTSFLRGNGGCGSFGDLDKTAKSAVPEDRPCDVSVELSTRPEQALIYRLSGDYNPLHADPAVATKGGFPKPILHGLCTYGMAGRAAIEALCAGQSEHLRRLAVRFSNPVYPGELIRFEFWHAGEGHAVFRAIVPSRTTVVLSNGVVSWHPLEPSHG